MAQNITLLGASYSNVPAVQLPKSGGGTALFYDTTISTNAAAAGDIANGKQAYVNGSLVSGALSVVTYYTGSDTPSSSLGQNGDIYLQE